MPFADPKVFCVGSVQLIFFAFKFTRYVSHACLKELVYLVESHCYLRLPSLRAATCLDFVIIEFKQQFYGNTHTHTHTHNIDEVLYRLPTQVRVIMLLPLCHNLVTPR